MSISDYFPDAIARARSRGPNNRGFVAHNALRALASRVITETGLQTSDGGSTTIALYDFDYTAARVMVGGVVGVIAAGDDIVLIGAAEWEKSYDLAGDAAVVITADGLSYAVALVAVVDENGVSLHAVFGAEATDGEEVEPTVAQIMVSLAAAGITDYEESAGVVVARFTVKRTAVDTMSMVHVDIDGDADMVAEREVGMLFDLTPSA